MHVPIAVDVLDAAGVSITIGEDADDPAVGLKIEVAARKSLGY